MNWIAKYPPLYLWEGDTWYNEKTGTVFEPDFSARMWNCGDESIPFHKNTKVIKEK